MLCGGPIAALYGFGKKFGRKINENLPNFFFRKKHFETRSETQFHQNRQFRANFRLINVKRARLEKSTVPESWLNSNCLVP